jgi:hypothetical protein
MRKISELILPSQDLHIGSDKLLSEPHYAVLLSDPSNFN